MIEVIYGNQITRLAKRIEKSNLRAYGKSLSFCSIGRLANPFIKESESGCGENGRVWIKVGWREAMKKAKA